MAARDFAQCVGPSYHLADRKAAIQSAINCYPQELSDGHWMMASAPGEVLIASMGAVARGSRTVADSDRMFWVGGDTLYEVSTEGVLTQRGKLSTRLGRVGMAENKTQLAIVDGPYLYIFNLVTDDFTQITADGWRGSNDVHELDGYFIFVDPDTDQFYLSAIDDGTNLDALDFSSADSVPDNIVAHIVSHRQAWFFGPLSGEIWINSGDAAFPFVRYPSYTLDVGCMGPHALIQAADTIFWIGRTRKGSGIVYMIVGNQPQRVSTQAVEEALRGSSDLSSAEMWSYQIEGHEFIGIDAPGLSSTWVYDAATRQWAERAEWADGWQPRRSRLVATSQGQQFAGDADGNIVRFDRGVNNLAGRPLVRERTWPHLKQPSLEPINYLGVELDMLTGYGGNVTLEISNNGGYTFFAPLLRQLGAIGRWMQRIRWNGLGTAANRVFRIRCSDDVPFAIYSATVNTP